MCTSSFRRCTGEWDWKKKEGALTDRTGLAEVLTHAEPDLIPFHAY